MPSAFVQTLEILYPDTPDYVLQLGMLPGGNISTFSHSAHSSAGSAHGSAGSARMLDL